MDKYEFRLGCLDDNEISSLIELFKNAFPKSNKFSKEYLTWQYIDNPMGLAVSFNAYKDKCLVAHYATIPIKMIINNNEKLGLLSLNTATDPQHQGRGLFKELANRTFEYAKEKGYEFVIGAANANSTHGFLKKLGFYLISPLDVKIGIGKIKMKNNPSCYVFWDKESISWRLKNPSSNYYTTNRCTNIYSNMILGVKAFIKSCNVNNYQIKRDYTILHPFNLYVGIGIDKNLSYYRVPKFIKHSPFNLVFKDLIGDLPTISKNDIKFELFDFDVI